MISRRALRALLFPKMRQAQSAGNRLQSGFIATTVNAEGAVQDDISPQLRISSFAPPNNSPLTY
jgi:hypothetical protein